MENVLHVEGQSRRSATRAAREPFSEGHVKVEVRFASQRHELDALNCFDSGAETRACDESDIELILPQGIVTWRSGNSMSTLDLAFATSGIAEQVLQHQPYEELDSDSDYIPIITSIGISVPQQAECPAQP